MGRIFYKGYNVQYGLSLARLFYCYNGVLSRKSQRGRGWTLPEYVDRGRIIVVRLGAVSVRR